MLSSLENALLVCSNLKKSLDNDEIVDFDVFLDGLTSAIEISNKYSSNNSTSN